MTGPEDSHSSTRPISVAELLARNGTIGAPPVGGRRRRRRGNTDAVTVAELTGEIPIISDDSHTDAAEPATDEVEEVRDDFTGPLSGNGVAEHVEERRRPRRGSSNDEAVLTDEEADYAAHIEERDAEPLFVEPARRRPHYAHVQRRYPASSRCRRRADEPGSGRRRRRRRGRRGRRSGPDAAGDGRGDRAGHRGRRRRAAVVPALVGRDAVRRRHGRRRHCPPGTAEHRRPRAR